MDFILEYTIPNEQSSRNGEGSRSEEVDVGSDPEELWMLHADGSSNATGVGAGAGLILTNPEGDVAGYVLHFEFLAIKYEAEYETLIASFKVAREVGALYLRVFGDSQLISKANNARAYALLKLAALLSANLENGTYFKILKALSLKKPRGAQQVDEEPCWVDPLPKYLRSGKLPTDRKEAQKIKKQATHYVLYYDKLYRRSFFLPLLKCLCPS
ncbi:uncharacterized protein [Elaeis guineensis]|uniref:uncharacterized protein n=1 Tax=Elaeis guineensis var. tenera TaxID=51953 RepID=UPI003C6CF296